MRFAFSNSVAKDARDISAYLFRSHKLSGAHEILLKSPRQLTRRLKTLPPSLVQGLHDDGLEFDGEIRANVGRGRNDTRLHFFERFEIAIHPKEALSGGHLPQHDSEGKDVGAPVDGTSSHLLR